MLRARVEVIRRLPCLHAHHQMWQKEPLTHSLTGLNKLQLYFLALKMALDADRA